MSGASSFVATLIDRVPALQPLYREHAAEYGEVLPHVFMGDVTRFAVQLHAQVVGGTGAAGVDEGVLSELLHALDQGMRSPDEATKELIAVSFLENLDREDPLFPDLRRRFGDALSAELRSIDNWAP